MDLKECVTYVACQVQIRLSTLALKPKRDITRSQKQGYQWPHKKVLVCGRDGLAAMLATKRSAGVTPEVNLMECVTHMPLPSSNKAAHSVFETQKRHHKKCKTGVSVVPQKGFMSSKNLKQ